MSTPYPLEEQAQTDHGAMWDPWKSPAPSSFGGDLLRSPYTILEGLGSGAAKGEAVLGGLLHQGEGTDPESKLALSGRLTAEDTARAQRMGQALDVTSDAIVADARMRVHALTPDAATTGTATAVLHGVASGAEQLILGSLTGVPGAGALAVGAGEGFSRQQELKESGVDSGTAAQSGILAGITSGAGALLPGGAGSTLLTRLATGAAGNTAFGMVNRFADHAILEAGGYPEMAEQQKVWDMTQMLVDAALGTTFGVIHHLASTPGVRDAALTANLALKDRQSSPGVATTPESAAVHASALEKATQDLLAGKSVDVSETGIDRGEFLKRPTPDDRPALHVMAAALKESGFLDEETNLRELEAQFEKRQGREPEAPIPEKPVLHEPVEEMQKPAEIVPVESVVPEGWREKLSREMKEQEAKRGPRWHIGDKPVWDMTPDEMDAAREKLRQKDTETLTKAFDSEEIAGKFQRLADSSSESAYTKATKMVDALPPEKRAIVEAWERGEEGPNVTHEELYRLANGMRDMRAAETPDQLANLLKYAITKLGDKTDPHRMDIDELTAAMELKEGHRVATENGWNTKDLSESTLRMAAARFSDPEDAIFMLRRFIKGAQPVGDPVVQAIADRPHLMITDDRGNPVLASDALEAAKPDTDYPKAIKAAADCAARRGS